MPMKSSFFSLLAAAGLALSGMGLAQAAPHDEFFETTQDLYLVCATERGATGYDGAMLACRSFIEGAVQYHDALTGTAGLKPLICFGQDATIEDGRVAFVSWAEDSRGDAVLMAEAPVVGLVRALSAAAPCKR